MINAKLLCTNIIMHYVLSTILFYSKKKSDIFVICFVVCFKIFDQDGDGILSEEEVKSMVKALLSVMKDDKNRLQAENVR